MAQKFESESLFGETLRKYRRDIQLQNMIRHQEAVTGINDVGYIPEIKEQLRERIIFQREELLTLDPEKAAIETSRLRTPVYRQQAKIFEGCLYTIDKRALDFCAEE